MERLTARLAKSETSQFHARREPRHEAGAMSAAKVSAEARKIYRNVVENARREASEITIPNRYPWHCRIGVSELLTLACERQRLAENGETCYVRLLTGTFPDSIYESIRDSIVDFLGDGGIFRIMVWDETVEAKLLIPKRRGLEVRASGTRERGDELNHFLIVDSDAYRFEAPHRYHSRDEFTETYPPIPARICFNDAEAGAQLVRFFDDIWDEAAPAHDFAAAK